MTLSPGRLLGPRLTLPKQPVTVVEELGTWCYVPGCDGMPEPGAHHIEPRSQTGGPRDFVLIDGLVTPNRCRLCPVHHRRVTGGVGGHEARIAWHDQPVGHWCWLRRNQVLTPEDACAWLPQAWAVVGPLRFPHQPEVACDSPAFGAGPS